MFFQLEDDRISLLDPYDFKAFKLLILGDPRDIEKHRKTFSAVGFLEDSNVAWVRVPALEAWAGLKEYRSWAVGLQGMLSYAKTKGWYDAEREAVRIHVEWGNESHPGQIQQDLVMGFRNSMRRLASSVTIITTTDAGVPHGMTATAVMSLSLDPLSIAVGINRSASIFEPLSRSGMFCVNILSLSHTDLCADFSGKKIGSDRFESGKWMNSPEGLPMLLDAQASILCDVSGTMDHGTHSIFIGKPKEIINVEPVSPLIYLDGSFTNKHCS